MKTYTVVSNLGKKVQFKQVKIKARSLGHAKLIATLTKPVAHACTSIYNELGKKVAHKSYDSILWS